MSLEQLSINGISLNDQTNFRLQSLTFTPAAKSPVWANNADADGELLVREAHYTNAFMEATVRIAKQSTADAARVVLGELTDALQECERLEEGGVIEWTPKESARTYTAYAELADSPELPLEMSGDDAGWLLGMPIVRLKLTLRPFLETPERTVKTATESGAEPLQTLYVTSVKGDVPAKARLIVTDKATQDRRFAGWAADVVESESNPALVLTASSGLTASGGSGTSTTRSGAYSLEKVFRGTALGQATVICGTGRIAHVGSYAVYLRVYSTSSVSRFRISYRNGDSALIPLEWKEAKAANAWSEIYMGEVFLDEVALGTQTSEIKVEQKAEHTGFGDPSNDVNYIALRPTLNAFGDARALANLEAAQLVAYDNFEQTAGNLEGKELGYPAGTTWAEVSKTGENGLKVNVTSHAAERAKVSDANLNSGCYALAGTTKYTTVSVNVLVAFTSSVANETMRFGVLARYASTEKWVMAVLTSKSIGGLPRHILTVIKNISGTVTTISEVLLTETTPYYVEFYVSAAGSWEAVAAGSSLTGFDPDFAPGGALAEGRVGIYDAWTSPVANTRTYDAFLVRSAEETRVCYSGKSIEFNGSGALRQDSTGTYDGPPGLVRGGGFYLQPAGAGGQINRLAVMMRRNDIGAETDATVTDKQSLEVKATERYLIPR